MTSCFCSCSIVIVKRFETFFRGLKVLSKFFFIIIITITIIINMVIIIIIIIIPDWIVVALSMIGRFAVCIAFATIYVYGAEVFPTVVRSSAMSTGVTFSRFGSVFSPYVADVVSSQMVYTKMAHCLILTTTPTTK